jgi:chorismate synthase
VPEVHLPRPGHADLVGAWKYGHGDVRNVLERASARETAARVAGGAVCRAFLAALGVEVRSHVVQIGTVKAPEREAPLAVRDFEGVDEDPVRCLDAEASRAMVEHINKQRKANESIGGVFEVLAFGLVPGLGSHTTWETRLDGRLAGALCSIQAVKGAEIGDGFALAGRPGSQAHDEIFHAAGEGFHRATNRSGGLEGGMTTGETLLVRAAVKPIPTLTKPLRSVDTETLEPAQALRERTDSCIVPAAGVVGEAMVAFVLAGAYREKFAGDHLDDVLGSVGAYRERIGWRR